MCAAAETEERRGRGVVAGGRGGECARASGDASTTAGVRSRWPAAFTIHSSTHTHTRAAHNHRDHHTPYIILTPPPRQPQAAPWSKTGGLGDVVGSLPAALAARGHRVMVVAPRYADYEDTADTGVRAGVCW